MKLPARLLRLENMALSAKIATYHRVVGHSRGECQEQIARLISTDIAKKADSFISRVIVLPGAH